MNNRRLYESSKRSPLRSASRSHPTYRSRSRSPIRHSSSKRDTTRRKHDDSSLTEPPPSHVVCIRGLPATTGLYTLQVSILERVGPYVFVQLLEKPGSSSTKALIEFETFDLVRKCIQKMDGMLFGDQRISVFEIEDAEKFMRENGVGQSSASCGGVASGQRSPSPVEIRDYEKGGGSRENTAGRGQSSHQKSHRPQLVPVFPANSEEDFARLSALPPTAVARSPASPWAPRSSAPASCDLHPVQADPAYASLISHNGYEPVAAAFDYVTQMDSGLVSRALPGMAQVVKRALPSLPRVPAERFFHRVYLIVTSGVDPVDGMYVNTFIPFRWPHHRDDLLHLSPLTTSSERAGPPLPAAYQTPSSTALFTPWRIAFDDRVIDLIIRRSFQMTRDDADWYRLRELNDLIENTLPSMVTAYPHVSYHDLWSFFVGAYRFIIAGFLRNGPAQLQQRVFRRPSRPTQEAGQPALSVVARRNLQHRLEEALRAWRDHRAEVLRCPAMAELHATRVDNWLAGRIRYLADQLQLPHPSELRVAPLRVHAPAPVSTSRAHQAQASRQSQSRNRDPDPHAFSASTAPKHPAELRLRSVQRFMDCLDY